MEPKTKTVNSQPSWIIESSTVEVSLTKRGGMMAPVTFATESGRTVQPYYTTPWQNEGWSLDDPVLMPLRGDFFCMPFGADNEYHGESHNVHGEPATREWALASFEKANGVTEFTANMQTSERPGTVVKRIKLKDTETVVYTQHELRGFTGQMTLGHHAILDPAENEGGLRVSTSPFQFGISRPFADLYNTGGEYSSIAPEAEFDSLQKVPTIWKEPASTDCSVFPTRNGYCDILALYASRSSSRHEPQVAWMAAVAEGRGYVWFALKDPTTLPAAVLWLENRGRNGSPWNGRTCCIGLEDVCAYLAEGLRLSVSDNPARRAGCTTSVDLSEKDMHRVNYIQGVADIPPGFNRVADVHVSDDNIELVSDSGKRVNTSVHTGFLFDGSIE